LKYQGNDIDCEQFQELIMDAFVRGGSSSSRSPDIAFHLERCASCSSLAEDLDRLRSRLDLYEVPPPVPNRALQSTIAGAREAVSAGARWRRIVVFRLVLAALISLPFVVGVNSVAGWAIYEIVESILSRPIANYVLVTFILWTTVGASLTFGSLPFFSLLTRNDPRRQLYV